MLGIWAMLPAMRLQMSFLGSTILVASSPSLSQKGKKMSLRTVISTLKTVKFDTVKTFMLYVALSLLSLFEYTQIIQGYKHYQHRNLSPLFSFGYVGLPVALILPHKLINPQVMDSHTPPSVSANYLYLHLS